MSTATMGDLDDISCKTCLQLKIVVLKASCCQTNSVKKQNKTKRSHSDHFVSKQWICQIEGLIQSVSIKWLRPYSDEFTLLIASKNALQRIKSNNRFDN